MTSPDPWHRIHAERLHLAEVLRALPATSWGASTLCDAWSVRDVVAHLTAAASTPTLPWLANMLATRFDTDLHNQRLLLRHRGMDDVETLDRFESAVTARRAPFGVVEGALGEVLVHGQDIAVPLGLPLSPSREATRTVAEFFARKDFAVDSHTLVRGVRLEASDDDLLLGDGPPVRGTMLSLVMAMAGRSIALDDLDGEGVDVLRRRLARR